MKRWLIHTLIGTYLFALGFGVFSHAVGFKNDAHPGMYFIVWDMFCGWAAYATRIHIVGEGESGRFYELSPAPWGDFEPFGKLGRRNYDVSGTYAARIALNTLRHTQHEPIGRIFVVEESWAKKYNLPDEIWDAHYQKPKDPHSYFQVLRVIEPDGTVAVANRNWLGKQVEICIGDNPRLKADLHRGKPMFAPQVDSVAVGGTLPIGFQDQQSLTRPGSRLGN